MKKYVLIVITFMSLSVVAMEDKKKSAPISIPLNSSPKHDASKRHLHIIDDIYGSSIGNDGVSPTAYFELGKLAISYPHPTNCMR